MNKVKQLQQSILPYVKVRNRASIWQMCNTILPFLLLWCLTIWSMSISYALTFLLIIPTAGFLVRMFIIFHDCCHQSFFRNRKANLIIGTITGMLTFHPYHQWRHSHAVHHATNSNLDKRGLGGEIWLLTVDEYLASSFWKRLAYRLYRNPFVMFLLGPISVMMIENRFNRKDAPAKERWNLYITNAGIAAVFVFIWIFFGWQAIVFIHLPVLYLAGILGIWLFYVQHQFEDSYFEDESEWDFVKAAVDGSSYYKLPKILQWLTGNIGFHHVHHLNPRVPNYNLQKAHENTPALHHGVTTVTLFTSLKSLRFRLWDKRNKRFIGFGELKQLRSSKSASV